MSDRPLDLDAVARDDELLTLLGSGARPDSQDTVIQALYAWRTDLAAGAEDPPVSRPATVNGATRVNGVASLNGAHRPPLRKPEDTADAVRAWGRRRAAVAAVVVGLSGGIGGVAVAAADAEPGSPLWPIAKVIYAEAAADRQARADAEAALAKARKAIQEGRVADAERYLDEADRRADSADSKSADELNDEVAAVREQLKDSGGPASPTPGGDDSPDGSTQDPSTPVQPPAKLPTPGTGGETDGDDKNKGKGNNGDDDRGAKGREEDAPTTESSELGLLPDTSIVDKRLPEL